MVILTSHSDQLVAQSEISSRPTLPKSATTSKEQLLLDKIAQGDDHAFWQLWLEHQDYLLFRCQQWMNNNPIDAEEALSQARLKAWEKLPQYAGQITNTKAWLTRLTHNLCVDIHRSSKKCIKHTDTIEKLHVAESDSLIYSSSSPETQVLRNELISYVRQAINRLPSRLKEPLSLFYYYQMSCAEIGQILMISKDTVYKRISIAKAMLQEQLNKYCSDLDEPTSPQSLPEPQSFAIPVSRNNATANSSQMNKSPVQQQRTRKEDLTLSALFSEQSELPALSVINNPLEIINYHVTALCLNNFSLAS